MVTKWGMSDKVGLFYVDDKEKQSVEFQELIDVEVSVCGFYLLACACTCKCVCVSERGYMGAFCHVFVSMYA